MLSLMSTAIPSLTRDACVNSLAAELSRFGGFFSCVSCFSGRLDNNSSMTVAQTGTYTGKDDISEYVG